MRRFLLAAAFLAIAAAIPIPQAHAEGAPLRACQGPAPSSWVVNGAGVTQSVCNQSLLRGFGLMADSAMDPLGPQVYGDGLEALLAGADVVGIREWHRSGPPPVATDGMLDFSQARLVEQGHVGQPGELWWGRVSSGKLRCCMVGRQDVTDLNTWRYFVANQGQSLQLVVGQESAMRLANTLVGFKQRMDFAKGLIVPWPAGAKRLQYSQFAATATVQTGDGEEPPSTLTNASIELSVPDVLSGTLHFTLSGGTRQSMDIPLKRDVNEADVATALHGLPGYPFRLREGRLVAGRILDCHSGPEGSRPGSRTLGTCYFKDQAETQPSHWINDQQYMARAMFFGAEAEYLAVVFKANNYQGLVILRRTAVL